MPKRNVRVTIPIHTPEKMITLGDAIIARHEELGDDSPLLDPIVDMVLFVEKFGSFKTDHDLAGDKDGLSQAATQEADIALGIDEGQDSETEGTIYFIMTAIIARLLLVHKGKEEQLSTYGLNVVMDEVRGRVTVRVDLPITEPEKMRTIIENVLQRHSDLGDDSPLNVPETDMEALATLQTTNLNKRKEAKKLDGESQAAMDEARIALGTAKGQTVRTKDTVYFLITAIRDKLLGVHRLHEEQLSTYGFNVVISMTPLPGDDEPETHTGAVNSEDTVGIVDGMQDGTNLTLRNTGAVALIFCRAATADVACTAGITVQQSEEASVTGADLGTGTWLNVTNNDPDNPGMFEVEIT